MPNQEINVDIKINSDALNQLPKYKAGFDNLRDAVNNLNKEIVNSTDRLSKLNSQQKETETWTMKLKKAVYDLADTYNTLKDVAGKAAESLSSWASIAAAAFTLITTYGPQVLDFLDNIFKSDSAKKAARSLEDYKDIMSSYVENIASEISEVQMLINVSKNEALSKNDRINAIRRLNELAPENLKNLTLENLKTKEGTDLLNEYLKILDKKSMQEAILSKRTDLVKQRYELKEEYDSAKEYKRFNANTKSYTLFGKVLFTKQTDASEQFNEVAKKDKQLIERIKRIDADLTQSLLKYVPKQNIAQKQDKEYWESFLNEQQIQLNKIDSKANDFQKQVKPIKAKIQQAKKMLELYEDIPKQKIGVKIHNNSLDKTKPAGPDPEEERLASIARMAKLNLEGYAKEIADADEHFREMKGKFHEFLDDYSKMSKEDKAKNAERFKATNKALEQFEVEHQTTLNSITKKFQEEDFKKLDDYYQELNKVGKDARKQAFDQLQKDYMQKQADVDKILENNKKVERDLQNQIFDLAGQDPNKLSQAQLAANQQKIEELEKLRANAESAVARAKTVSDQLRANNIKDTGKLLKGFANEDKKAGLEDSIAQDEKTGNWQKEFTDKQHLLDLEYQQAIEAEGLIGSEKLKIQRKYKDDTAQLNKAKQDAEVANQKKYLQSLTSVASAVTGIFGKNTIAARLAFKAQQAAAAAQVIIETKKSIMNIWSANSGIPFVGVPKAIAETALVAAVGASNLAAIIKQKPGFARGGQYTSDGRGALLPGYSHTDNTNAYLRSGEAVVVSEAMRNPWARNLVSAINVAHGGRDFSVPNAGRGYAIGGIFTDGGNANRYYSQPVNDQKDLANTLAYQMINNFPPIYVDVKDVNNQQNILAQTVDRVNL
jgi:hypothetical protein